MMALLPLRAVRLLDEPVAGLAEPLANATFEAIKRLQQVERFGLVVVEHRLRQIATHANRVIVMREGRIAVHVPNPAQILDARWLDVVYHAPILVN